MGLKENRVLETFVQEKRVLTKAHETACCGDMEKQFCYLPGNLGNGKTRGKRKKKKKNTKQGVRRS